MASCDTGEWAVLQRLLPPSWQQAARRFKAFRRARRVPTPAALLRLLLWHAVSDGSLRSSAEAAADAGLAQLSDVALRKRLAASVDWLRWLNQRLCLQVRANHPAPGWRLRALDGSTIQGPRSKGVQWRLHYTLDLQSLDCDWHHVTDAHTSEALELTPVGPNEVLIADRNYLRPAGVRHVRSAQGHLVVRLKWTHPKLLDPQGRRAYALTRTRRLRVDHCGDWRLALFDPDAPDDPLWGRVVALKLPAPLAERQRQRALKSAKKKGRTADPRSLEAAQYVMLFTTLPEELFDAAEVLNIYRWRWQVEVAFKRLKQLLRLGHLPHSDEKAAQGWILSKLTVALLLEKAYRQALSLSPWGYELVDSDASSSPLALVEESPALSASGVVPGPISERAVGPRPTRRQVA